MNPSFKLLLVLIIALEVSFTRHLTINLVLVAVAIIYLLTKRIRPRLFGWLFLMPLFPAVAVFITIAWFSPAMTIFMPGCCFHESIRFYRRGYYADHQSTGAHPLFGTKSASAQ